MENQAYEFGGCFAAWLSSYTGYSGEGSQLFPRPESEDEVAKNLSNNRDHSVESQPGHVTVSDCNVAAPNDSPKES